MAFNIFCTNCGQKLEAEDEHIGHEVPCPKCERPFIVSHPNKDNSELTKAQETKVNKVVILNTKKHILWNIFGGIVIIITAILHILHSIAPESKAIMGFLKSSIPALRAAGQYYEHKTK